MTNYTLNVDDGLWERFKDKVPKSSTLNDIIVGLIENFVGEKE